MSLPESMKRSMSRQAEAERERRARIITADGEYQASKRLAAAANVMARDPAALQLRLLQTVVEVAAEKNSTLVMPVPVELLRFFEKNAPPEQSQARPMPEDLGDAEVEAAEAAIEHTPGPAALESESIPPVPEVEPPRVPEVDVPSAPQVGAAGAGAAGRRPRTRAASAADTDPVPRTRRLSSAAVRHAAARRPPRPPGCAGQPRPLGFRPCRNGSTQRCRCWCTRPRRSWTTGETTAGSSCAVVPGPSQEQLVAYLKRPKG